MEAGRTAQATTTPPRALPGHEYVISVAAPRTPPTHHGPQNFLWPALRFLSVIPPDF